MQCKCRELDDNITKEGFAKEIGDMITSMLNNQYDIRFYKYQDKLYCVAKIGDTIEFMDENLIKQLTKPVQFYSYVSSITDTPVTDFLKRLPENKYYYPKPDTVKILKIRV